MPRRIYHFAMIPVPMQTTLKTARRLVAPLLLFSGVTLLGCVGLQYGTMLLEQRRLEAAWRQQQSGPSGLRDAELTRISIPRIQLSAVMVEGTDLLSLMLGPGHLTGSAEPGDPGNTVISAHRDTFFRGLMNLNPGDNIVLEKNGRRYTYAVEGFRIVRPSDTSVAAPTTDSRLTLITCDPAYHIGPAPQRLVVIGRLVQPAVPPQMTATEQTHIKRASAKRHTP